MRLLLDTNVVVSGLLWSGPPASLLKAATGGQVDLVSSIPLLRELSGILARPKLGKWLLASGSSAAALADQYRSLVHLVTPSHMSPLAPDPEDDVVIATALAGQVDLLVTGDGPLLSIKEMSPVRLLSPREALRVLTGE